MEEKLRRFVIVSQMNSVVVDRFIAFWKSGNGDSDFSLHSVAYFLFSRIALFGNSSNWRERERSFLNFVFRFHFTSKEWCCYFIALFSSQP